MSLKEAKQFTKNQLTRSDLDPNPFVVFHNWISHAYASNIEMPNAMSLATVSKEGQPSVRTVLLKHYDENGLVFFTNYRSKKAQELIQNSKVALKFYWRSLERQLIVQGKAQKIPKWESVQYYISRAQESKIGAWCSDQTEHLSSREVLSTRFQEVKTRFNNKSIPKPKDWGGFKVVPHFFEYWQGRKYRLHDRFQYNLLANNEWSLDRVAP